MIMTIQQAAILVEQKEHQTVHDDSLDHINVDDDEDTDHVSGI